LGDQALSSALRQPQENKALNIGPKTVVSFHYTLRDEAGTELESSRGSEPSAYLQGANNIIPGLEAAMTGKAAGDVFSATVAPGEAYGLRDPNKAQRVPMKHLVFKGKLRPGAVVQLSTSEGMRPVTVTKAGRHSADIDTNHPLAGQTLTFDVEVMEVRAATPEELAHGHAHGPGGHHH
jgi:FKBP-type peptidyl-prolyl cis-trans isomerase SlyD